MPAKKTHKKGRSVLESSLQSIRRASTYISEACPHYFPKIFSSHEYGLPLHKNKDSKFLVLLVGLMSFLAILAFSGFFTLNAMAHRWSSGLENKITIEVLAETREGMLRAESVVKEDTKKIINLLANNRIVSSFDVLSEEDIHDLIAPWIGNDLSLDDIPLPRLITVELHASTAEHLDQLTGKIEDISHSARVNTHHEWLGDLTRLTSSLQMVALLISLIIGVITVTAISSAVRTRMTIHKKEIQLLHLMGATDHYIASQLQRQSLTLALQGAMAGTMAGLLIAFFLVLITDSNEATLIPQISLSIGQYFFLLFTPAFISLIAGMTARYTVLRELAQMP